MCEVIVRKWKSESEMKVMNQWVFKVKNKAEIMFYRLILWYIVFCMIQEYFIWLNVYILSLYFDYLFLYIILYVWCNEQYVNVL